MTRMSTYMRSDMDLCKKSKILNGCLVEGEGRWQVSQRKDLNKGMQKILLKKLKGELLGQEKDLGLNLMFVIQFIYVKYRL